MKKVLILQNKGKSVGGIWFVNKSIATELTNNGYEVEVLSIRNNVNDFEENNLVFKTKTINEKDLWEITHKGDVIKSIKKFSFIRTSIKYLIDHYKLKLDFKKSSEEIIKFSPDYIIVSQYQLLDVIPNVFLSKTVYHHHTSFDNSIKNKSLKSMLLKYNGKIRFLWLTDATMKNAMDFGLLNNYYIYNPVRYENKDYSFVKKNKITVITRFGSEKRIPLMVEIVDKAFKISKDKSWSFELYGGDKILNIDYKYDESRIRFMGVTNDPQKILLESSINLNTSIYEGFSLSILESNECGVPTITFNFGESVNEQIIDGKTGIIAKDVDDYINKLADLIDNKDKLATMSMNCWRFNKKFYIETVIKEWYKLFDDIDGGLND